MSGDEHDEDPEMKMESALIGVTVLATVAATLSIVALRDNQSEREPSTVQGVGAEAVAMPMTASPSGSGFGMPMSSRTISTEGTAVRRVAPDLASIVLSVRTTTRNPAESQQRNESAQKAVIAAVKAAGVPATSINPFGLDISESQRTEDDVLITEYTVATEVHIDTKDLAKVGSVLERAFSAGATTGRVEFKTTRLRELRDKARRDAVKAAKEKAQLLTESVDASVGRVVSINEGSFGYWGPTRNVQNQNVMRDERTSEPFDDDASGAMDEQFGGGMISISAQVSATFEMNV
jgi:uncharacterized protein